MNRHILLIASLGAFGIACNEYELVEGEKYEGTDLENLDPDIEVDPGALNFGDVYVDGVEEAPPASITEVVTISNVGDGPLQVQDLYLADEYAPYTIGAITTPLVQPGGSAQFSVTFTPSTSGPTATSIIIESNDPDEATVEVPIEGVGVAPIIEVTPATYAFGDLFIGCDSTQFVTISNQGNAPLIVSNLIYTTASPDLSFDNSIIAELPFTLGGGESQSVALTYAPLDEFPDSGYLLVESNDPYTPAVTAQQSGDGSIYGDNQDLFDVPIRGKADIIFAVDRSCSMYDDIENMQDNFDYFTSAMANLDADFQIAATVDDDGCINGDNLFIDSSFSTSEARDTITDMIEQNAGYGAYTERAFQLLEECLGESVDSSGYPDSSGCNYGLVRREATLNLVGVSDEPEQSVGTWDSYVTLFQGIKASPDDVVFHAIGGDPGTGCSSASPYTGFIEAANATAGLFLSICASDWGGQLEDLAEGAARDLSSYDLTEWPVPSTIEVEVDGITTTVGWRYDAVDNSIEFDREYVPEGGSQIVVDYVLYGDCEG